jgi:uncharacterized protein (TIGR02145 family)
MKQPVVFFLLLFLIKVSSAQTTYTFNGNGNWTVTSNWSKNTIPPAVLPSYDTIVIRPAAGDSCVLNTSQTMSPGSNLVIAPGAIFIVRQGVAINNPVTDSTFIDSRDGQVYTFRHIGTQVWMTKNLSYATASGSWCHGDNVDSCAVYGRLYDWKTALRVAPPGWHLPSDAEWQTLIGYLGGSSVAGGKMKETGITHWLSPNTGADNVSGFTGLPAGYRLFSSPQEPPNQYGFWWSSTESDERYAWNFVLNYSDANADRWSTDKAVFGLSVRCIRDVPEVTLPGIITKAVINLTNTSIRSGGIITTDGSSPVISSGLVWGVQPHPTIVLPTKTVNSVITDTFNTDITGLQAGTSYYVRAYITNSAGIAYGNEISFTTTDTSFADLPVINTTAILNITNSSATSGGIITTNGASPVVSSGVVWDTIAHPTIALPTRTINTTLTDTFGSDITGLRTGTTYYVRAYATNNTAGTAYGNEISFSTATDSTYTDPRDRQVYTFRHIGSQVWMTKNLNYATSSGSRCYNNTANCEFYGRLYDWNAAIIAPPPGWHLPSDAEWQTLIGYMGGQEVAGGKLKEASTTHWRSPNAGADNSSHFAGLPGGAYYHNFKYETFEFMGIQGAWWSSTENGGLAAWTFSLYYNNATVKKVSEVKEEVSLSVRCIRD